MLSCYCYCPPSSHLSVGSQRTAHRRTLEAVIAIFTDLDGTLLDAATYSFEPARPALQALAARGIPCILVTSKTAAEVEPLRRQLDNHDPFIVENGGAVFIPHPGGAYDRIECGVRYEQLTGALERASEESGCRVRGFHTMTNAEVAELCGFGEEQARLAKRRLYDEPFVILDPEKATDLFAAFERRGLSHTLGGRFHHIFGGNDKGRAVEALLSHYRRAHGQVHSIGLGDGPNDAAFLEITDVAVIVRNAAGQPPRLRRSGAIVTTHEGPRGWNEAVLRLIG